MDAERWKRVDDVVQAVLAAEPADRTAVLDARCGSDEDLRREVESLLAQAAGSDLLAAPAWQDAARALASDSEAMQEQDAPGEPERPIGLVPGQRLGPYEVVAAIGAGGMGEVYEARDTRLGRIVALKVLPRDFASDPERRRRFEHEARAASALNHPHICTLYDIGSASSPQAAGRPTIDYLVLEHLDGETLAARLTKGPLPVAHVVDVGAQIADALSAAHRAGIVHRDLKPGNVMLTKAPAGANGPSGLHATLLDFGLAKRHALGERPLMEAGDGDASASASLTARGEILGTWPYMAPEQVEGKPADARTDLWALGAVLYEMLTGRRAFEAETPTKVAAAILEHEPTPIGTLQPGTPPALARLITKCLAKDPDARWDTAHDVADELRWTNQTTAAGSAPVRTTRLRAAAYAATGFLLVGAAVVVTLVIGRGRNPPRTAVSFGWPVEPADELNAGFMGRAMAGPGGANTALAWTPDGDALAYAGRVGGVRQLFIRPTDGDAVPIEGTNGAFAPAVSTDGQWVAFWAEDGAIKKVPLRGGTANAVVSDLAYPPSGLAWTSAGHLLYGSEHAPIREITAAGAIRDVTALEAGEVQHVLPRMLPGERAMIFTARTSITRWGDERLVAYRFGDRTRTELLRDAADGRYLSTGHLVFMRRGVLWAVGFDPERLEARGTAMPVLDGVAQALAASTTCDMTGAGHFDVSGVGALAYVRGGITEYPPASVVELDRQGRGIPLPGRPRPLTQLLRVSPDGKRLALTTRGVVQGNRIGVLDLARDVFTEVVREGESWWPAWLSDNVLMFRWNKDGRESLSQVASDGSSGPRSLAPGLLTPASVDRSRGRLVAISNSGTDDYHIVAVDLSTGVVTKIAQEGTALMRHPEVAPDGRLMAYTELAADRSGGSALYVRSLPEPGARARVHGDTSTAPAWHPKGRELFFVTRQSAGAPWKMMVVDVDPGPPLAVGSPRELFEVAKGLSLACAPVRCYDVAPDGQHFYAVQTIWPPPPVVDRINVVLNWAETVKAKVPVG